MRRPRRTPYRLEHRPIARGGQAQVFLATHRQSGDIVALKRLISRDEESIARMRREIEVQTSINHPNIMPIFDYDPEYYWYTMPLAEQVLGYLEPPIDEQIIFEVVEACARGLGVAHQTGNIHRDLTPRNILRICDNNGTRWVVSDWGLVRRQGYTSAVRTPQGQTFGTEAYAPPEMWTNAHNATASADVYSLGRVVAWCLGVALAPNFPVTVTGAWSEFITYTTNLDPTRRVQDMESVLLLLENVNSPGRNAIYPLILTEETQTENFTGYMRRIIEYLWNNGAPREATLQEIRENVGPGAYGNHNKLSLPPWDLVEDGDQPRTRRLTEKGIRFIQGTTTIPRKIVKNPITQEWMSDPSSSTVSNTEV